MTPTRGTTHYRMAKNRQHLLASSFFRPEKWRKQKKKKPPIIKWLHGDLLQRTNRHQPAYPYNSKWEFNQLDSTTHQGTPYQLLIFEVSNSQMKSSNRALAFWSKKKSLPEAPTTAKISPDIPNKRPTSFNTWKKQNPKRKPTSTSQQPIAMVSIKDLAEDLFEILEVPQTFHKAEGHFIKLRDIW